MENHRITKKMVHAIRNLENSECVAIHFKTAHALADDGLIVVKGFARKKDGSRWKGFLACSLKHRTLFQELR